MALYLFAGLALATDGNFYGTAVDLNGEESGTIFQFTPGGALTTLYTFKSGIGPAYGPFGPLIQGTDGNFYGTTSVGGNDNGGTVYSFSMCLGPFIKTLPKAGGAGEAVTILGTNLTGATRVTFNGTESAFTVNSSGSEISTTVPAGATSGKVRVTTPGAPW